MKTNILIYVSLSLTEPQVVPPELCGGLVRPVRHHHHGVSPDGSQQFPHGVERPGQLTAEPVPLLEDDDEDTDLLKVGEEPDQVLQVVKGGVEAWSVDHRDWRGLGFSQPGSAGVGTAQCSRL